MPCTARRAASPYLQIPSLGVGAPTKEKDVERLFGFDTERSLSSN